LGKNGPKSPYFKEIKFKFAIFRPYNMLSKYSGIPKKILLSSRERPNGLWLRLLVNDLPVHLPHKIGKNKNPQGIRTGYLGHFLANRLCYLSGLIAQFG
jgi:hypothetical protein